MKEKTIFFVKLLIVLLVIFCFAFYIVMPQYSKLYTAGLIDKLERVSTVDQSKIIIVGDSNVAFGFDCALIEESFNMPVVNFGLQGSLGIAFHCDAIKPHISKGDIVILAPHCYHGEPIIDDPVLAWTAVENNVEILNDFSAKNIADMVKAYPTYFKRALKLWIDDKGNISALNSPYSRDAFNEYGDIEFPRPKCIMTEENYGNYFSSKELSVEMKEYWNDYSDYVKKKGAVLYMSCPPIFQPTLYEMDTLYSLQKQLESELNFKMISQLEDYIYPYEMFYDTGLHLNDTGKILRTQQFIKDLNTQMQLNQDIK